MLRLHRNSRMGAHRQADPYRSKRMHGHCRQILNEPAEWNPGHPGQIMMIHSGCFTVKSQAAPAGSEEAYTECRSIRNQIENGLNMFPDLATEPTEFANGLCEVGDMLALLRERLTRAPDRSEGPFP